MIGNKRMSQMMSIETLDMDSALIAPDLSFFSNGFQIQHSSELIPNSDVSEEWLQGFGSLQSYCDGIDVDLYNEPEFTLEAMPKGVVSPEAMADYLDSTAFLSPVSIEPNSPQRTDAINENLEQPLDFSTVFDVEELNNTSAMSILEEILSATHPRDCEEVSDNCFDDLSIQSITEVPKEEQMIESTSLEIKRSKRQAKRKVAEMESRVTKPKTKRSKTSINERKDRKRRQNKSAANRYRQKKRVELDTIEEEVEKNSIENQLLMAQLQKLQMEFKVLFPLAKAAFASVPHKALQLQLLDIRVLDHNLLD